MGKSISPRLSKEWSAGRPGFIPEGAQIGRGLLPSFADGTHHLVDMEYLKVSISTPAITAQTSVTVSGTQGFSEISSVNLAKFDTGRVLITNVSASAPANTIASHPTIQIQTNQGKPIGGVLQSGTEYSNLKLSVSCTLYAVTAATAGTLTIEGTALLIGSVQDV